MAAWPKSERHVCVRSKSPTQSKRVWMAITLCASSITAFLAQSDGLPPTILKAAILWLNIALSIGQVVLLVFYGEDSIRPPTVRRR